MPVRHRYSGVPALKGRLRIYLGYAAGVGKTYRMLEDAQELKRAGADVVIGYFEPHARPDTTAKTIGLESIPLREVSYRGSVFDEMDAEAVLARKPAICLVDEFPHTNTPGSPRAKRWEDVDWLLLHGIDVYTTMNVQHLESLNDKVWQISGIRVRETIPDWVMQQASEVIMVDVTPRALQNRLERGVVYAPDKAQKAMDNFFRESTLRALRELALRQTAHEVDIRQESAGSAERILVHITEEPATAAVIRRAKRVADYLKAGCYAVYVKTGGEPVSAHAEKHLNFARNLHIETRILEDVSGAAAALITFARLNGVTQMFLPWPRKRGFGFKPSLVQLVIREAIDMEISVIAERSPQKQS